MRESSALFWDEPETNLNPKMFGMLMDALLELQRNGVRNFFAAYDYGLLGYVLLNDLDNDLDIQTREDGEVAFHSLFHDAKTGEIACNAAHN